MPVRSTSTSLTNDVRHGRLDRRAILPGSVGDGKCLRTALTARSMSGSGVRRMTDLGEGLLAHRKAAGSDRQLTAKSGHTNTRDNWLPSTKACTKKRRAKVKEDNNWRETVGDVPAPTADVCVGQDVSMVRVSIFKMGDGALLMFNKYSIYKVTAAIVEKTKRNFEIYKIQLNNEFCVAKLVPLGALDRECSKLYQLYTKNNKSLDFLIGKYISISVARNKYGFEFNSIESFDVFQDFKKAVDGSNGNAFSTRLPIYDFLSNIKRPIEHDGSIKIVSDYGDMRVSKAKGVTVCCRHDVSSDFLNLANIDLVFDKFYKDVPLPAYDPIDGGSNSYYEVNMAEVGIVKMDNHVKVSHKMTTSGDYNKWIAKPVLKIGDELPQELVQYLDDVRQSALPRKP